MDDWLDRLREKAERHQQDAREKRAEAERLMGEADGDEAKAKRVEKLIQEMLRELEEAERSRRISVTRPAPQSNLVLFSKDSEKSEAPRSPEIKSPKRKDDIPTSPPPNQHDLAGLSAVEAAKRVLADADGEFLHHTEIARRAVSRGYRSRKYGDDPTGVDKYILDSIRRRPLDFARKDVWYFQLAPEGGAKDFGPPPKPHSRAGVAEQLMRDLRRPVKTTEIAERLNALGLHKSGSRKRLLNSIQVALDRSPRVAAVAPGEWWFAPGLEESQMSGKEPSP